MTAKWVIASLWLMGFSASLATQTDWTVFVYIESDKDLNEATFKNLYDLARGKGSPDVVFVAQLHCWGQTAWRFIIKDHALHIAGSYEMTHQPAQDLINGMRWAFTTFPAQHYMVVLNNHGFGILDPVWNEHAGTPAPTGDWQPELPQDQTATCPLKIIDLTNVPEIPLEDLCMPRRCHTPRGILFSPSARVYLNNQGMVEAFSTINTMLHGQKIDIVGMDACKMAMVEIAYQLAPYANYVIGSQDCELKDGWDYCALADQYGQGQQTPKAIAMGVVHTYGSYYRKYAHEEHYTQAAIDLNNINDLVQHMDCIWQTILALKKTHAHELNTILLKTRATLPQFCEMPSFADIINFYQTLKDELVANNPQAYHELIALLEGGITRTQSVVIANTCGKNRLYAHGLSIYFPRTYQPSSYTKCLFAQQTHWCSFLEAFFA